MVHGMEEEERRRILFTRTRPNSGMLAVASLLAFSLELSYDAWDGAGDVSVDVAVDDRGIAGNSVLPCQCHNTLS